MLSRTSDNTTSQNIGGGPMHGRSPHLKFLGGPSPKSPLGLRPCLLPLPFCLSVSCCSSLSTLLLSISLSLSLSVSVSVCLCLFLSVSVSVSVCQCMSVYFSVCLSLLIFVNGDNIQ